MKACIFDLDGTLTNTIESLTYSVNLTLKEMHLEQITMEQCRQFVGNGARYLMERAIVAGGDLEGKRIEESMEIYARVFDENCTYKVTPYEGIREMIAELKERGILLGVLSNKPNQQTVHVVETVFGKGTFDFMQGQKEGIRRKPDPEGFFRMLEDMKVEKEECLYVGDSEVDVAMGIAAGANLVAVDWGFRPVEVLEKAGAERIISRPEELLKYI